MNQPQDFDEMMREHEAELLREGQAQIAKEDAAYRALPQAEKDRIQAEYDAKNEAMEAAIAASEATNFGICSECSDDLDASEAEDGICYDCQNGE